MASMAMLPSSVGRDDEREFDSSRTLSVIFVSLPSSGGEGVRVEVVTGLRVAVRWSGGVACDVMRWGCV